MDETPLEKVAAWLDEARSQSSRRNPLAMAVASCSAQGLPSVRMVLAKDFCRETGHLSFFTHYASRKGTELTANSHAAAVMYWEEFGGRQLRIEGPVSRVPDDAADAYFATRPAESQLNAWVSEQSRELPQPDPMQQRVADKAREFGIDPNELATLGPAPIPRPPHWGGLRILAAQVEFWTEGQGRFHERIVWRRSADAIEAGRVDADAWQCSQLQP